MLAQQRRYGPDPPLSSSVSSISGATASSGLQSAQYYDDEPPVFHVLCLHDFHSPDPDHLSFRKNEILEIVKTEDSGWWAALSGDRVGWVPEAFVQPLSKEMADALMNVGEELRSVEIDAAEHAPTGGPLHPPSGNFSAPSPPTEGDDDIPDPLSDYFKPSPFPSPQTSTFIGKKPFRVSSNLSSPHTSISSQLRDQGTAAPPALTITTVRSRSDSNPPRYSPPPTFVASHRPSPSLPLQSPLEPTHSHHSPSHSHHSPSHSHHSPSHSLSQPSARTPTSLASSPFRASPQTHSPVRGEDALDDVGAEMSRLRIGRSDKVRRVTGDDDAAAFHNAKAAQAALPWYLQPKYGPNDIKVEYDGTVKAATVPALVERLTIDPLKLQQELAFRKAFLTTFKTFSSSDEVFDLLTDLYMMDPPNGITEQQYLEWKEKRQRPTQARVLTILTSWLEDHAMLDDDPHIVARLREFLRLITTPPNLALTAKLILQSITKLSSSTGPQYPNLKSKRKQKSHKNELLKIDPLDLAEHLTLLESKFYMKVRPFECLNWVKAKGEIAANLAAFCATSDKLASWVKYSVLTTQNIGKRVDIIDYWIKVAEKCRTLNNISSMSALVAALSSVDITRLHLTWAHVTRSAQLEPLGKITDPSRNFESYRALVGSLESPCIPFIGMHLTDLNLVNDQQSDNIVLENRSFVNFVKRQRMSEIVQAILKYQAKPHSAFIAEHASIMTYIDTQIHISGSLDQSFFWKCSQDLLAVELTHADIRKGLEAAGF